MQGIVAIVILSISIVWVLARFFRLGGLNSATGCGKGCGCGSGAGVVVVRGKEKEKASDRSRG